jgi:hypothetical protein
MGINSPLESSERFRRVQIGAQISDLLGLVRGKNTDLVSYEEVARRIKAYQQIEMGTQMVPLEKIVGSVGRYRDFTSEFLPRTGISKDRWTRVDRVLHSLQGYPPIELYKIGDVYFVRDGNHRVSVARANGLSHIEAYVTEIQTHIDLTPEDFTLDSWIVKVERSEFITATNLDELRPNNNLHITEPGRYPILLRHIFVHQYLRNKELEAQNADYRMEWEEAVCSWYDNVYVPVVEEIRKYHIMGQFPGRTEADLYLWITHHREELATHYGLAPLSAETAVSTFAEMYDDRPLVRALKGMRWLMRRVLGNTAKVPGMSDEEFAESRARHEAGERSIMEVDEERAASEHGEPAIGAQPEPVPASHDITEQAMDIQRAATWFAEQ